MQHLERMLDDGGRISAGDAMAHQTLNLLQPLARRGADRDLEFVVGLRERRDDRPRISSRPTGPPSIWRLAACE